MSMKVRLPSDNLTPAQLKQLNGPVIEYNTGRPMKWAELLELPDDVRKGYLEKLRDEYKATQIMLAGMLGISITTFRRSSQKWGLEFPKTGGHLAEKDRRRWEAFLGQPCSQAAQEGPGAEKAPEPVKDKPTHLPPRSGSMTFHGPADAALRTMQEALRDAPCIMTITWETEGWA